MPVATYFLLVATTFFWGGTFIAGRMLAGSVSPLNAAFLRFFIASIALWLMLIISEGTPERPTRKQLLPLLLLGLSGVFAYNIFFFTGLTHISAGRASLIIATTPLVITICSRIIYREPLTLIQYGGILLSITGAIFVISNGHPGALLTGGFGPGEFALMGCVVSWSAYTLIGRAILSSMSPLRSVFYSSVAGTALLLIPALLNGLPSTLATISLTSWSSLLYLGICGTALGFSWYYQGIKKIGATRAGVFINLVPVFALLLSWSILSESLKPSVISGGAMVLCGVFLANRPVR